MKYKFRVYARLKNSDNWMPTNYFSNDRAKLEAQSKTLNSEIHEYITEVREEGK